MGNAVERCWAPISPGPQSREPSLNPSVQPLTHARDGDLGYAFSTGHPPSFPTHQSGGCLLCGHSALVLAHTAEWIVPALAFVIAHVCFQALTYSTMLVSSLSSEKIKSSTSHPFLGPLHRFST